MTHATGASQHELYYLHSGRTAHLDQKHQLAGFNFMKHVNHIDCGYLCHLFPLLRDEALHTFVVRVKEYHGLRKSLQKYAMQIATNDEEMHTFAKQEAELLDRQAKIVEIIASRKVKSADIAILTTDLWDAEKYNGMTEIEPVRQLIFNVREFLKTDSRTT